MSPYEYWSLVWSGTTALVTLATLLVVVTAAFLTYRQVYEASRVRKLEAALAILDHISAPDLRNARRLIYMHHTAINEKVKCNPSWEELDTFFKEISQDKVDMACFHTYLASLENVSILVMHDLAPDDVIEMYFARMAPHHWQSLDGFITFMRRYYGSNDFLQHFEMFNRLLEKEGLSIDRRLRTGLLSQMRSGRIKRELLAQRREQRKTEEKENGLQHINIAESENRAKTN